MPEFLYVHSQFVLPAMRFVFKLYFFIPLHIFFYRNTLKWCQHTIRKTTLSPLTDLREAHMDKEKENRRLNTLEI